jgi:hypothetical protein
MISIAGALVLIHPVWCAPGNTRMLVWPGTVTVTGWELLLCT